MTFKIVVANSIHAEILERLEARGDVVMNSKPEPWGRAELMEHCADAHALMAFMTESVDAAFLDACPSLRIIAGALKGYNNIDVDACTQRSVAVTIVPDLLTEPTAELTIGLMIALARNIIPGDAHMRSGSFEGWRPNFYGDSIQGSVVGVLGAGAVGKAILRMLNGFDCRRLYVDKTPLSPALEAELNAEHTTIDDIRSNADFVVLALHLMPSTFHLVDDAFLAGMKPQSFLINPGRGSLVDEAAVARALDERRIAGYAADTFEMEDWKLPDRPRHVDQRLLNSDKTVLTPHIGSAVRAVRQAIELSAAQSIVTVRDGGMPDTIVNRAALAPVS